MKIDYSSLEKAFSQLKDSLGYLHSSMVQKDEALRKQFRNSVIQCFAFTYELTYKMLKRQLSQIVEAPGDLKQMNFADLIRTAAEAGLVQDVKRFLEYRAMRNLTSHTYDQDKAEMIVSILNDFQKDVTFVIAELKKRNA